MRGMLEGKVAIVTGAGAGIGRAAAELFAAEGARVVVADLPMSEGREVAKQIAQEGEATFVEVDVSDPLEVGAVVATTVATYGRLDCAFNNAGVNGPSDRLHEIDQSVWERQLAVNLSGVWHCLRAEITQLLAQGGGGAIVNTASDAGIGTRPRKAAYMAAKHGVIGLTRAAAIDYAVDGIRVNAVCPGGTRTSMMERYLAASDLPEEQLLAHHVAEVPMGRMGRPNEPAEAALWLLSERTSYITGQLIVVDGGRLTY
jgi:NAD(P)-dependent dehydrogenase (short-subunit alcohol dehydrogenase family)